MKNKTYLKSRRKKSIASLILAFLLMLTFNSSPMIIISNNIRNGSAFKSSETKKYYTSPTNESETKISKPNYPSSYKDYIYGADKNNFNVLSYYNEKFDEYHLEFAHKFFSKYDGDYVDGAYQTMYEEFLKAYGVSTLSEFYKTQKDQTWLKAHLESHHEEISVRSLIKILGIKGFPNYTTDKSLPPISNLPGLEGVENKDFINLSEFYRIFANVIVENNLNTSKYPQDTETNDGKNNLIIKTNQAFYEKPTEEQKKENITVGNTHYNRIVTAIENKILETAPIYAFDGKTQDTNIASLIANGLPTSVEYNYASTFTSYTKPSAKYQKNEHPTTKISDKTIYYMGKLEDLPQDYRDDFDGYLTQLTFEKKSSEDVFYYVPTGHGGSTEYPENFVTYYRYQSIPYITTTYNNIRKKDVFVKTTNSTTQSELDTYSSIYFNPISDTELEKNKEFYVQVPYEADELYFKAIYNDLFSNVGFYGNSSEEKFKTFVSCFTIPGSEQDSKESILYLKLPSETEKYVYIDESEYDKFITTQENYKYIEGLTKINTSESAGFNKNDYEQVTLSNNHSKFYVEGFTLYVEKVKTYYDIPADPTYDSTYETTYNPKILLETEKVPSNKYVTIGNTTTRQIFIVSESDSETITAKDGVTTIEFPGVKQSELDAKSKFYVKVPAYVYKDMNISDEYNLYYKHTEVDAKMLFVVDDSDNASSNEIYKTLNFNVISSTELKENITTYVAVQSGDINYNKDFQLYYKHIRNTPNADVYILNQPGIDLGSNKAYKLIDSSQLSDYSYIDPATNQTLYETVRGMIHADQNLEIKLYYKLNNIFVQNNLKGGNAIYILENNASSDKDKKETYSRLMYTPIKQADIDKNPDFYVLVDSNDPNYFADYKLYYKYERESTPTRVIYSYEDINQTTEDFSKLGYELITEANQYLKGDYKPGQELYYKKNLLKTNRTKQPKPTDFYYQTTSTTTLSANSYYAISFYVNTIGEQTSASFYIKDTAKAIENISVENIKTSGKWEKHYIYLSTDFSTSSTVNLYMYFGDEVNGVKGTNSTATNITGSVFFDDIKITKISLTDFNTFAIDTVKLEDRLYKDPEATGNTPDPADAEPEYADEYNNRLYFTKFDSRKFLDSTIDVFGENKWKDIFDFDDESLQSFLGKETADTTEANQLAKPDANLDGYSMYTPSFNTLWKYYISRDLENDFTISNYITAYTDNKLEVTTTNKIEESEEPEDDEDTESESNQETSDIKYYSSPFNKNNFALKLKNTSENLALGITSNSFKVKQFEFYKVSLWIYSPDLEGKATISVNSILKDRQHPVYGSLLSTSVSSTYANVENSSSKNEEYGWIPVTIFIEGNNFEDMDCYLVLTADKDCTVYFDNIRIEKATSAQYEKAKQNGTSDKYSATLSLTPSSSLISTTVKNGTFDYVKESSITHDVTSSEPYEANNWTLFSTNSSRVVAGIVSTQQDAFFNLYSRNQDNSKVIPKEYDEDLSNVYAIYAPSTVKAFDNTDITYKHTYSMYCESVSLDSNSVYKISFKFYKNDNFIGNIISNIYSSAVKTANIISSLEVDSSQLESNKWHTLTYYIATSTSSSQSITIEIGVEDAQNTCFFKNVASKKLTGKTLNSILQSEATKAGINNTSEKELYDAFTTIRFLDLANSDFSFHSPEKNETTDLFDTKSFKDESTTTSKYTAGSVGVKVASYFDTVNHTVYSVTIDKTTYYIGEVYETTIKDNQYFVHKTYDSAKNTFSYKLYSDSELTNEVITIDGETLTFNDSGVFKVLVGTTEYNTTTTYRLYKFADLREEVKTISGSVVSVPSLDKVVLGKGAHAKENAITSKQNSSHIYHFSTPTTNDFTINNTIISAEELINDQSGNVLILSNSYSTDYITLSQSATRTLGKSTYNVLRIYVKTSDFEKDDIGLNIDIDAVNVNWKNINTTKSEKADKYGFVCYEVLIQSNSTDSISNFGVKLSLGNTDNTSTGYAIISKVALETVSNKETFEHYSALVGDDNENIKKAIYTDAVKETTDENQKPTDDKNSVSWATFFYIFSSILLVVTMAVAMIAIFLKKHPIKLSQKYENDHERDIQTNKEPKKQRSKKVSKDEIIIDLANDDKKEDKSKKSDGEII